MNETHYLYHFTRIDGGLPGELLVISDQPKSAVIAAHCPTYMELNHRFALEPDPDLCGLPCDRTLIEE